MRLAFCNPPLIGRKNKAVEAEDCCWGVGARVLPAMLLACASEAQRAGHDAAFIDLSIDEPQVLEDFGPDLIFYPLTWHYHVPTQKAMAGICPDVSHITLAVPAGYAGAYADTTGYPVIFSEPERVIGLLSPEGMLLHEWRYDYGIVSRSCEEWGKALPNCLADLGPIDYTLVPEHYWTQYAAAIYQVTRGCPYKCRFCVWGGSTVTDTTFRMRPAELVAGNLKQLRELSTKARGKPIPLYMLAAQLTTSNRWINKFHREMSSDPYPFQSNVNLGDLTEKKVRLLMAAGMVSTSVGLEAVTTSLLERLGKPYTFEKALQSLLILQKIGIKFRAHIRYGFGESEADVQESVDNLHRMREAGLRRLRVDVAPIVHYEGTMIRKEARYELTPLPRRGVDCLIMADPPDWTPFIDTLREFGWLTSVGAKK